MPKGPLQSAQELLALLRCQPRLRMRPSVQPRRHVSFAVLLRGFLGVLLGTMPFGDVEVLPSLGNIMGDEPRRRRNPAYQG